jgi:hypothetical protein
MTYRIETESISGSNRTRYRLKKLCRKRFLWIFPLGDTEWIYIGSTDSYETFQEWEKRYCVDELETWF